MSKRGETPDLFGPPVAPKPENTTPGKESLATSPAKGIVVRPDEQDALYRKKAEALLERYDALRQWLDSRENAKEERRALVVEFAGMPKAGKSGAIEDIRHFFSHGKNALVKLKNLDEAAAKKYVEYKVDTPAEGVSLRTPGFLKKEHIHYNCWAGSYSVQELLQARHDNYHDIVILDRGPWDAGCWLQCWIKEKGLDPEEFKFLTKFFHDEYWMTQADLHVVLTVDPAEAKHREQKHRLIDHGGAASKEGLMTKLKAIYEEKFPALQHAKARNCPDTGKLTALFIDTTKKTGQEVSLEIIERILDVLEAKIKAKAEETIKPAVKTTLRLQKVLKPLSRFYRAKDGRSFAQFVEETEHALSQRPKADHAKIFAEIDEWLKTHVPDDVAHNRAPQAVQAIESAISAIINDSNDSESK